MEVVQESKTDGFECRCQLGFHEDCFHVLVVAGTCRLFYFIRCE